MTLAAQTTSSNGITLKTKASYGVGALGKDFACSIIYIYLMFYYTDVVGLSAVFVGTLFLVTRAIDAITDPIMGMIVDNTRSKYGKFRPWIVIGTLLNAGCLVAIFFTHNISENYVYVYASLTYILWGITYTIMDIPYWSMIPSLSSERPEREKLVVWPRIFASFAWLVMGAYGLQIIDELGEGDKGVGFFLFSVFIIGFFIFSSVLTAVNVKEKVAVNTLGEKFIIKDAFNVIAANDQLKVLVGAVLSFNVANQLIGGFAIYYFTYAIGKESLFPVFMLASGLAEMAGVFLFPYISALLPRRFTWIIACAFPILCCLLLWFAAMMMPESALLVGVAGALFKFGVGLVNGLSTVMLADVVDYGEHHFGKRSESIIFSVQTMLVKFAGAFAGFFVGVGLSLVGYVANAEQTASTVLGLKSLMIALPIILMMLSAFIYQKWYQLHEGFSKS